MSTKIYSGCKINVSTLKEYQDFVYSIKELIVPRVKEIVFSNAVDYSVEAIHKAGRGEDLDNRKYQTFIDYGYEGYRKAIKEDSSGWIKTHSAEVAVFMLEDKVLAMPFFGDPKLETLFKSHELVEEYGYWDNTDEPEDVTDEEWDQRCEDWNKALGGDGYSSPVESGSIIVFDEPDHIILSDYRVWEDEEMVERVLKKVNERYHMLVHEEFIRNHINEATKDLSEEEKEKSRNMTGFYLDAKEELQEFKKTEEYAKRCEEEKADMTIVTPHLLKSRISDFDF